MEIPRREEVEQALEAICTSRVFANARRQVQLLRYLVLCALDHVDLKETVIGHKLFGLRQDYDPDDKTVVRVTARNLRKRLDKYYETLGRHDRVMIRIRSRGYLADAIYKPEILPALDGQAAQHVWKAKAGMNRRTVEGYEIALHYLHLALEQHPDHQRILAFEALAHLNRAMFQMFNPRAELELAEQIVSNMHWSDASPWEAWLADACIKQYLRWDWDGALRSYDQAIALSGGEAKYYQSWYTALLISQRRCAEAIAILSKAVESFSHDLPVSLETSLFHRSLAGVSSKQSRPSMGCLHCSPTTAISRTYS